MIAKPGNKTAAPSWPAPYVSGDPGIGSLFITKAIIHKVSQLSCVVKNSAPKIIVDCGE